MKRLFAAVLACFAFAAFADMSPIMVPPQATITLSCATTATTALPSVGVGQQRQIEISNAGTVAVFIEFGASTVTATTAAGYPYLANQTKVQTIKADTTHVACVSSSGTQTVYVTVGIGQ